TRFMASSADSDSSPPSDPLAPPPAVAEPAADRSAGPADAVPDSTPLFTASFTGLVVAAALGALNDNVFRWSIVGISKHLLPEEYHALVLAIGSIMLVAPFLPLASPAGWAADRFSKGRVVGWVKFAEILIMSAGAAGIWAATACRGPLDGALPPPAVPLDATTVLAVLFTVLAFMGAQSAFFGPVKYGGMAELVPSHKLAAANGVMALVTYLAIIFGAVLGNLVADYWIRDRIGGTIAIAGSIVGIAAAGYLATFFIRRVPAANPARKLSANLFAETFADFKKLSSNRPLFAAAVAAAYFWSLGALATLIVDDYGGKLVVPFGVDVAAAQQVSEQAATAGTSVDAAAAAGAATTATARGVGLSRAEIGPLQAILAIGIGIGSVLAGLASAGRIELGQVPVGALGMAVSCAVLWWIASTGAVGFVWAALWLALLGLAGGLYDVPLASYLQDRCPPEHRGAVIAVNNFMTFSGVMLMSAIYPLLRNTFGLTIPQVFLAAGLVTLAVFFAQWSVLMFATMRFIVGLIARLFYRVRVYGADSIPDEGPALLISNHVTYADGLMLSLASPRKVRMVAY
ncbi:MAG TPA: 1-acyl-sn-glycerol-3-phosphate acyltransferase, partial [Pirellulales bacterium]